MIGVLFSQSSSRAGMIVQAAIARSVSSSQVVVISRSSLDSVSLVVAIDIPEKWGAELVSWLRRSRRKLIILGCIPSVLISDLGWQVVQSHSMLDHAVSSEATPIHQWRASSAAVHYSSNASVLGASHWVRHFERFDFADEWNNLGFGAIRADGSCWSVAQSLDAGECTLASIEVDNHVCGAYAALAEIHASSILWFNRAVGPCDSYEWRIVENYLSRYGADCLPCQPVLSEIPWGYDAAVTSRLDCDEDVESARALWDAYRELNIPFSLAVHTSNLSSARHHSILSEVLNNGGAVLSHSATHPENWGGSYAAALRQGEESATQLQRITGKAVRYAVSPFHQTPHYALQALADAGYFGCIGGGGRSDPEFTLARGGEVANIPSGFIGHSQQCMLHGDCMLAEGDPLLMYKQSFDQAFETQTLFGYLDHPFSERYAYGWLDEQSRIQVHRELIQYIQERAVNPIFLNEDMALDFLSYKSKYEIIECGGVFAVSNENPDSELKVAIEYSGKTLLLEQGDTLE